MKIALLPMLFLALSAAGQDFGFNHMDTASIEEHLSIRDIVYFDVKGHVKYMASYDSSGLLISVDTLKTRGYVIVKEKYPPVRKNCCQVWDDSCTIVYYYTVEPGIYNVAYIITDSEKKKLRLGQYVYLTEEDGE